MQLHQIMTYTCGCMGTTIKLRSKQITQETANHKEVQHLHILCSAKACLKHVIAKCNVLQIAKCKSAVQLWHSLLSEDHSQAYRGPGRWIILPLIPTPKWVAP